MAANILIVEDNQLIREVICEVLRDENYEVVEASDGDQALDLLHTQCFDLLITDFTMPNRAGIKFAEQLNALQSRIPIIFIAGRLSYISLKAMLDDVAEVLPKRLELDPATIRRLLKTPSH